MSRGAEDGATCQGCGRDETYHDGYCLDCYQPTPRGGPESWRTPEEEAREIHRTLTMNDELRRWQERKHREGRP